MRQTAPYGRDPQVITSDASLADPSDAGLWFTRLSNL